MTKLEKKKSSPFRLKKVYTNKIHHYWEKNTHFSTGKRANTKKTRKNTKEMQILFTAELTSKEQITQFLNATKKPLLRKKGLVKK